MPLNCELEPFSKNLLEIGQRRLYRVPVRKAPFELRYGSDKNSVFIGQDFTRPWQRSEFFYRLDFSVYRHRQTPSQGCRGSAS
jgi:hypothetical protein